MKLVRFCYALAALLMIGAVAKSVLADEFSSKWPTVLGINMTVQFLDARKAGLDLNIKGSDGHDRYALKCHTSNYDGDADFYYSGLLQCRLLSLYSKESVSTLLTETLKQTTDWGDRGRFLTKHLLPGCAQFPDWGATRTFFLRNMKISIAVTNIKIVQVSESAPDGVESYSLNVSASPDVRSQSSIAQPPKTKIPKWFFNLDEACPAE